MENEEKVTVEVEENAPAEVTEAPAEKVETPAEAVAEEAPANEAPAASEEEAKPNFFKTFIHDFVNYFKTFDAARIMHWCQGVFVAVITIVMTKLSLNMFYNSAKSRMTFEQYFEKNKSLMVSYTVCSALTWIFLSVLVAWGIGKLIQKRFKKWFAY